MNIIAFLIVTLTIWLIKNKQFGKNVNYAALLISLIIAVTLMTLTMGLATAIVMTFSLCMLCGMLVALFSSQN
ncbi:MAG: hypothetical protein VX100_16865 [Pseudomonadota bacterium]|nr:hypothetical protein [Pseudomonadota bacterium]